MVAEVEASVNPDAIVGNFDIFLGRNRPLALRRNPFALVGGQR